MAHLIHILRVVGKVVAGHHGALVLVKVKLAVALSGVGVVAQRHVDIAGLNSIAHNRRWPQGILGGVLSRGSMRARVMDAVALACLRRAALEVKKVPGGNGVG